MGRMKEEFMKLQEQEAAEGHRDNDQEEFILVKDNCINCDSEYVFSSGIEAHCEQCGQDFIYALGALRFK